VTEFVPTDTTVANVPDLREDANSPHNLSAVQSQTLTLAGTFDVVRMVVTNTDGSTTDTTLNLQLNGVTSTVYTIRRQDSTFTQSATAAQIGRIGDSATKTLSTIEVLLTGSSGDQLSGAVESTNSLATIAQSFSLDAGVFPLDTVTLFSADGTTTFSATVELYGRTV